MIVFTDQIKYKVLYLKVERLLAVISYWRYISANISAEILALFAKMRPKLSPACM